MGRKQLIYDFTSIPSTNMSTASVTGEVSTVGQTDTVTFQVTWTGGQTTNGDFSVEASLDNVNWYALDFGATMSMNTASDYIRAVITEVGFNYVRPKYTRTNGSATGTFIVKLFATTKGA